MSWILTYRGHAVDPLHPDPSTIDIGDIAHALSMNCRFNGHCRKFYSVAEHCVLMSQMVDPRFAMFALMHDAAEAYLTDVPRPIKPHLGDYRGIEDRLLDTICHRFAITLSADHMEAIKEGDLRMLAAERSQIMPPHPGEWECLRGIEEYPIVIEGWSPGEAKQRFANRYLDLLWMEGI